MGGSSRRARYGVAFALSGALLAAAAAAPDGDLNEPPTRTVRAVAHDVWPSDPRLRLPLDQGGTTLPVDKELVAGASSLILIPAGTHRIPGRVLAAYQRGEELMNAERADCHVSWPLLAAIGRIESAHARGGDIDATGLTNSPILGPRLDGGISYATITDHDGGRLDGDPRYDRAVGPMQFLPTSWARYGRDGNADGARDPHNVFDAVYGAAVHLCSGGRDMAIPAHLEAAIFGYNHSYSYVQAVLAWMRAYAAGVTTSDGGATVVAAGPAPLAPPMPVASPSAGPSPGTPGSGASGPGPGAGDGTRPPAGPVEPTDPGEPPPAEPVPVEPGSISGRVVDDLGRPVSGVRVSVDGPESRVVASDAGGNFLASELPPGTYQLSPGDAAGYGPASPVRVDGVEISTGEQFDGVEFRLATAAISGWVFEDADGDGRHGATEPGIWDVPVRLIGTDDRGQPIDRTLRTDRRGAFRFTGLLSGVYTLIEVEQPAGYADGDESGPAGDRSADEEIRDIPLDAGAHLRGFGFGELRPDPAPTSTGTTDVGSTPSAEPSTDGQAGTTAPDEGGG